MHRIVWGCVVLWALFLVLIAWQTCALAGTVSMTWDA